MFRPSTIIRELALNLAKVIFVLKYSVKLQRYILCGFVAACLSMWLSLFVQTQSKVQSWGVCLKALLPHNPIINNNVISPNVLTH